MKLSFTLPSKPSSNAKKPSQAIISDDSEAAASSVKEYVTEYDPSKAPAGPGSVSDFVIPPIANEWEPRKRMKNLDLPSIRSSDDQPLLFEVHTGSSVEPSPGSISYGLNIRQSVGKGDDDVNTDKSQDPNPNPDPMLRKLKDDLKRLPDDNDMDVYAAMPVENFAAALLKGYGWYEGRGVGRNAKDDVKVVEFKRWSAKEGIGFSAALPKTDQGKAVHKNGSDEKSDGKTSNGKEARGGKEGEGMFVGKHVRVVGGREIGMKGKVVKVRSSGNMIVRLSSDDREVIVQACDVADLGSVEDDKCMRKLKELKIKDSDKDSSRVRHHRERRDEVMRDSEGREERTHDRRNSRHARDDSNAKAADQISWLASHIRVRIISKDLKRGKLYLKKGKVVDVVGPSTCDISMDESQELIQGVNQDQLETALPKRGGPVLVLYGRHKGVFGSLLERDSEKETGVVRNADTHELLNVRLEQIAEYIGDPSDIGY
ncbi:unnamed protein product [Cuscuta campestris]|uniref:G-patch domain-containing protein n=2 Tax=Cuscuta sect. Cleistogrammica TaxID=1824901 RepID=A0A484KC09_9ASTE|nr:hypothetical protein DM860_004285 [Cuscuta australis]VFQ61404.1 unnamed protein product [Cuscuta campestris]